MRERGHLARLIGGVLLPQLLFGAALFLPAGTLHWWRAWVFLGLLFAASLTLMVTVFAQRPALLAERYRFPIQKGQPLRDKLLTPIIGLAFFGMLVLIPLDRFHLKLSPGNSLSVALFGLLLFVGGWLLIALALRANDFAAPIVKAQRERGQYVVQSGPYAYVRHPLYAGAAPFLLGIPLWFGSLVALGAALLVIALILSRIGIEERFLRSALPGYGDYCARVRWRIVPGVW